MIKCFFKKIYFLMRSPSKSLLIKSCEVSSKVLFGSNIKIEKNTFIDSNCEIGSYTFLGKNCNLTKVKIGRYCSIANNVSIGQGNHHLSNVSTSSIFYKNAYDELTQNNCVVGNDVWIGTDAIILRNVKVGDGAVVGANSVVTKNVPPFSVVAGCPARILKYRFSEESQKKIVVSKWWDYEIDDARVLIKELES